MKKLLVLYDVPNWAFWKIATNIQKYSQYDVTIERMSKIWKQKLEDFDLIFSLIDFRLNQHVELGIPKDKLIIGVRSDFFLMDKYKKVYEDKEFINSLAYGYICSNKIIHNKFIERGYNSLGVVEGGVDTELFKPVHQEIYSPIRVGWSGAKKHFAEHRGFDIIEKACKMGGFIWYPAFKEDRFRTEEEMSGHYKYNIDCYVDLDLRAGRQNGLVEAASSGKWIISAKGCGIAEDLIKSGYNGLLVDRTVRGVLKGIKEIIKHPEYRLKAREEVLKNWSWESHVKRFDKIFSEVL